jgi:RNA polymerase sigma-70 factor (ECF subfamily)
MIAEQTLILQLQRGDPDAIQRVVRDYAPSIYRLAFGIIQDSMEAQDVTQDVFVSLIRRIGGFQEKASIGTWIYRIAVNASLDRIRARQRRKETVSLDEVMPRFTSEGKHAEEVVDWSQAPLERLLSREARQKIREAMERLPEDLRVALVMKDVEGFHLKEIGEILGLSLPAVKSRLHRARLALRALLTAYFREKTRKEDHDQGRRKERNPST